MLAGCVKAQNPLSSPDGKGGEVPSRWQAQGRCSMIAVSPQYVYGILAARTHDHEVMPHCSSTKIVLADLNDDI